jgi:hypothetical protein
MENQHGDTPTSRRRRVPTTRVRLRYFLWLLRQTEDGLLYFWPITAGLLCLAAVALLRSRRPPAAPLRGGWAVQFVPFCAPLIILALGTIYVCESCSPSSLGQGVRHVWALHALDAVLFAQVAGALTLVWLARGRRWTASIIQALALWCTFWASFIAGMSIAGDWL